MKYNKSIPGQENHSAYKSISRAANILVKLGERKNTVSDIAWYCKLSKPTASRLLKALEESNLAIRDHIHRKYYLGPLMSQILTNPTIAHFALITSALGEMNRLSVTYGETVALGILIGIQHIRLHTIPSRHNIRIYEDISIYSVIPNFQGAATRVLLSQLERKALARIMNHVELENFTDSSIVDKEEYMSQIKKTIEQGYAISHGEKLAGALAISVPIKGYCFPAVLSIMGVETRMEPRVHEFLADMIASVNSINHNISKLDGPE